MGALIEVILPVFLVIGIGYLATWRKIITADAVEGLMYFATNLAVPILLFLAISRLDLSASFQPRLMISFYTGAVSGFFAGLLGARFLFSRPWPDAVAIGFVTLFSNSLLLGLPITERAFGPDALGANFAIISIHAPTCYVIGVMAMEIARSQNKGLGAAFLGFLRSMAKNGLVIGIAFGFVVNLGGFSLPAVVLDAFSLIAKAAIPAALFGLGGVLYRYRPEGDIRTVAYICAVSLGLHPAMTWMVGRLLDLDEMAFRSAVITAAMAPGVNAYVFANLYGVAKRVAATAVLVATILSIITAWGWLMALSP
ncbi:AEC family transporter [Aliiroseovarius crassostreae]|uniref:AEC family transporter n=1 Tax=Aliiroseovarius crassostreae TaxID=154981 RepID=A0A9Q9LYL9_9RHOB|nr:AEC family transporter [Aliiroseovarius crassostreae]UWP96722.1 AEC family transporter [Aliiroseovarius crassostreae]